MNKVELLFKDKDIPRVGTTVFKKQVAIEFINECNKHNIDILGIDALLIAGNTTQPSLENSIDFSVTPRSYDNWDAAIKFLNERSDIYYFEIVCAD
jgi:hypothetical protein